MKIIAHENIFPLGDYSCHASHFALLPDGGIFAVWFQGSAEGKPDVRIYGALRTPSGKWEDSRPLTPDDGVAHWNPVLHLDGDRLILCYKVGYPIPAWHTEYIVSTDGGRSFSEPRELVPGDMSGGRGPVRNKIVVLPSGRWLAPASTEGSDGVWSCFIDVSDDSGKSWTRSNQLYTGAEYTANAPSGEACGIIQPTLWCDGNGAHAFMRSTLGHIFRSDSEDGARWCDPYPTELPNNNSSIDLDTLPDGRIILACNPVGLPRPREQAADAGNSSAAGTKGSIWGRRSPLSLLCSSDGGQSFTELTRVATGKGVFAYPALRCADGRLHLTYTWNRKLIIYSCIEL